MARELQLPSLPPDAALQREPFVVVPATGPAVAGNEKLRQRVTGVAIATAVYFAASALIQVICGLINEKLLEKNLRSLADVQAVPELTWLMDALPSAVILSAVPVLVIAFFTGCLFATCGIMGAKGNSECCACCYCCCNACYCVSMMVAFLGTLLFLRSVSVTAEKADLWFAACDPKICYPLGLETNVMTTIDCLAPAVWDDYTPRFEGDHLPEECPPIYLQCDEEEIVEGRSLQSYEAPAEEEALEEEALEDEDAIKEGSVYEEPAVQEEVGAEEEESPETEELEEHEEPVEARVDEEMQEGVEEEAPETAEEGSGYEESAVEEFGGEEEPVEEGVEEEAPETAEEGSGSEEPAVEEFGEEEMSEDQAPSEFAEESTRSENPLKALAQSVLDMPMPEDPLAECKPSKIVALYKVARREAPAVFDAVWKQTLFRLASMIPGFVLLSLGFWWGHDHWNQLGKIGQRPAYVLSNLPFGQAESADVQMTHMSQPLMNQQ